MQTKDLRVGTAYAYKYAKWSDPQRVTLLEAKADEVVREGYRTSRKVGAKVRLKDGQERIVQPREIVSTWDQHVEEERQIAEAKAAHAKRRHEHLTERAGQVYALSERLLEMGWAERHYDEVNPIGYCYNSELKPYLKAAGFKRAGESDHYRSAFYALDDVVRKGNVPLEAALLLAGLAEKAEV